MIGCTLHVLDSILLGNIGFKKNDITICTSIFSCETMLQGVLKGGGGPVPHNTEI